MARKRAKANYFTKETEDYIVKYNESTDQEYRNKIFTDHIYLPSFSSSKRINFRLNAIKINLYSIRNSHR